MGASPGDEDARADEFPPHRVRLSGFWMDRTEVTNGQFAAFVRATGYITTAERPVRWEDLKGQVPPGTPEPPAEPLRPGALVFRLPAAGEAVSLDDPSGWWVWVPGADWRHPEGPGSSIVGRERFPVVQVSYEDAAAYARWAEKRLPTEAEWEYAARGGMEGKRFAWGDGPVGLRAVDGERAVWRANIWQGRFPLHNDASERDGAGRAGGDGFVFAAPVGSFAPNGFGLYDMAGNVWEWCTDWYRADTYARVTVNGVATDPRGPAEGIDLDEPVPMRVVRGGSFLCSAEYCSGYRVSARMKTSPDTALMHTGFRCASDRPPPR